VDVLVAEFPIVAPILTIRERADTPRCPWTRLPALDQGSSLPPVIGEDVFPMLFFGNDANYRHAVLYLE
jgi:hypothetical protein